MELRGKGRHDPCVLPRAVPMVEAMVALVLVDHVMMQHAQCRLLLDSEEGGINPMGKTAQGRVRHVTTDMMVDGPLSQRVDEE